MPADQPPALPRYRRARLAAAGTLSALAWAGWLAWDTEYDFDPVTNTTSGPYQPWQVTGCVLTLLVAAVIAGLAARSTVAAIAVTLPFAVGWTVSAALTDHSGLFVIGAVLVAVGLYVGSSGVAALSSAVVRWPTRRAR